MASTHLKNKLDRFIGEKRIFLASKRESFEPRRKFYLKIVVGSFANLQPIFYYNYGLLRRIKCAPQNVDFVLGPMLQNFLQP